MPNINLFMIRLKVNHTAHAVSQLLFFLYACGWFVGWFL